MTFRKNISPHSMIIVILDNSMVTDEGLKELATLPKLEDLKLYKVSKITGEAFKYFRLLKTFNCNDCEKVEEEKLAKLLQFCNELKDISLFYLFYNSEVGSYRTRNYNEFLKKAGNLLARRSNGIPLIVRLHRCKIRFTPIIDLQNGSSSCAKIFFEIDERKYYQKAEFITSYSTFDKNFFFERVKNCE